MTKITISDSNAPKKPASGSLSSAKSSKKPRKINISTSSDTKSNAKSSTKAKTQTKKSKAPRKINISTKSSAKSAPAKKSAPKNKKSIPVEKKTTAKESTPAEKKPTKKIATSVVSSSSTHSNVQKSTTLSRRYVKPPKAEVKNEAVAEVAPEPTPTPEPIPEPIPEPAPAPTPEPTPAPEPISEPTPEPISEPAPKPISEPAPAPKPAPFSEPAPDPAPAPIPEPTPAPAPAPTPKPAPAPAPAPKPAPTPVSTHKSAPAPAQKTAQKPTTKPVQKQTPKPEPKPSKRALRKSAKKAQAAKIQAEKRALKSAGRAADNLDEPVKMERAFHKKRRGRRIVLALFCSAATVGALVAFVHFNMPDISVRVAAMQTGIEATYPTFVPRNYSLANVTSDKDGVVTMVFNGPDDSSFTLSEERSTWDSNALLNNYVKKVYPSDYTTLREQGITIYHRGEKASWVNGGLLYKIESSGKNLTKEQIRNIATSL